MPSVSAIIATNRGGPFLQTALASVDGQDFPAVEVIVVDDGSPDRLALEQLRSDGLITHLLHQSHSGVSVAWNRALRMAKGDLVAFLGDDDRWPPTRLASHSLALRDHPEAVMSVDDVVIVDAQGRALWRDPVPETITREDLMSRRTGVLLGNCIIRRDIATLVGGFHPALLRVQDFDFVLRVAQMGPIVRAASHMEYRQHAGNATARHREVATFMQLIAETHLAAAQFSGDTQGAAALKEFSRKAQRYAAWSGGRKAWAHLLNREPKLAASELAWIARVAPRAPLQWARKRVTQRHVRYD